MRKAATGDNLGFVESVCCTAQQHEMELSLGGAKELVVRRPKVSFSCVLQFSVPPITFDMKGLPSSLPVPLTLNMSPSKRNSRKVFYRYPPPPPILNL